MAMPPVGAVEAGAVKPVQQQTQIAQQVQQSIADRPPATEIPAATLQLPKQESASLGQPSFAETLLDGVYNEIDRLSSQVPNSSLEANPIDQAISDMASQKEATSPMPKDAAQDPAKEALNRLNNAFDHAIFMALVNQAVSGVSDTSRTLIRQS